MLQKSISDAAFQHLVGIQHLEMDCCHQNTITDAAFAHLTGIRHLRMVLCNQSTISDAAFVHLNSLHTLNMNNCNQPTITDAAFAHLVGIHTLYCMNCNQTTLTTKALYACAYHFCSFIVISNFDHGLRPTCSSVISSETPKSCTRLERTLRRWTTLRFRKLLVLVCTAAREPTLGSAVALKLESPVPTRRRRSTDWVARYSCANNANKNIIREKKTLLVFLCIQQIEVKRHIQSARPGVNVQRKMERLTGDHAQNERKDKNKKQKKLQGAEFTI